MNDLLNTGLGAGQGLGATYAQQQQQTREQRQAQIFVELERAARAGDFEVLQNIVEEYGGTNEQHEYHSQSSSSSSAKEPPIVIPKKELNKVLLMVMQNHSSSNKTSQVLECINVLLGANANVDAADQEGKTALMIACRNGFIEIVECLIDQDANVTSKDSRQWTPLLHALEAPGENLDVLGYLIKKGVDVNHASIDGWTPLLKATEKRYHDAMKILLDYGANAKQRQQMTQNTALHIACLNGDHDAVEVLIKHGGADLEAQNKEKDTPLDMVKKQIENLDSSADRYQEFSKIYGYLKNVWDEREKKAQQAKEELVRQEEMNEERERKKLKAKQQQQTATSGRVTGKAPTGQQHKAPLQQQQLVQQEESKLQQDMDVVETQEDQEEEKKGDHSVSIQEDEYFQSREDPSFLSTQSLTQEMTQQQPSATKSGHQDVPICNPLSVEILGLSPKIDFANPFVPNSQMSMQQYQQFLAFQQQQQEAWMLQQQQQMIPPSGVTGAGAPQGATPSNRHSLTPQNRSSPSKGGINNSATKKANTSASFQGIPAQSSSHSNYPLPNENLNRTASDQQQFNSSISSAQQQQQSANRRLPPTQQQQQQQTPQPLPVTVSSFNNNTFEATPPQQQSTKKQSAVQQQSTNNTTRQNKSLPFPNNAPSSNAVMSPEQQQQRSFTQQPLGSMVQSVPNNQSMVVQQPMQQQQIPIIPQTNKVVQQPVGQQQQQQQQQLQQALAMFGIPGAAAALGNPAAGGFQMNPLYLQPFGFHPQQMPPQFAAQAALSGLPPAMMLTQPPVPSQAPVVPQQTIHISPPQQQQHPTITANNGGSNNRHRTQYQHHLHQQSPITDELDLSEPSTMQSFIQDQQLYYTQKRLEEKERELTTVQANCDQAKYEKENLQRNLEKADTEIYMLRNTIRDQQSEQFGKQEQLKSQLINEHKDTLERMSLQYTYETNKLREHIDEMKRQLMKFHNVQQNVNKVIQQSYDEKRPINDQEFEELKKNLSGSQLILNQLLLSHNQDISLQMKMALNSQLGQQQQQQQQTQQLQQPQIQKDVIRKETSTLSMQSNRLIHMIERFEEQNPESIQQDQVEVYKKLHLEILQFRDSVKEILAEMQPLKEQLIENISAVIQKALPHSEVKVYGSHATKLCLPWSDIDLVIITHGHGKGGINDHPKSVLSQINKELQHELQNKWVSSVTFVDNATVPVVKVNCHIKDLLSQQASNFTSQEYEKYKIFLEQPFNIDITQMTDHHNGLECVRLVQDYLAENEVIEPLILVLKQLLKANNLNNPYFGGLSSYALFLMIVSFLQNHDISRELSKVNLGRTLISFLTFYGNFDHENNGISCHLPAVRPQNPKDYRPNNYPLLNIQFMLMPNQCVQIDDPLNNHNNVGKSSFKFYEIKYAFDYAQKVFFLGCFCDCHNFEVLQFPASALDQFNPNIGLLTAELQKNQQQLSQEQKSTIEKIVEKRQCDSVLSRVIYSYKIYEQFFGPFQHMV